MMHRASALQRRRRGVVVCVGICVSILFATMGCDDDGVEPDTTAPAPIVDLEVVATTDSSVTLHWTAPGDDGQEGSAERYDLRYSSAAITNETEFLAAAVFASPPQPAEAGTVQTAELNGLTQKQTYHFAMRAVDEEGNWSALSNAPLATLPPGPFSFEVTVVDASGTLVPGLEARLRVPLTGIDLARREQGAVAKKARTAIRFSLASAAQTRAEIFDQRGLPIRTLFEGLLPAGQHEVVFDGTDDLGRTIVGTQVLRMTLVARDPDTGEVLFEDEIHPVLATGADWSLTPVIGTTDAEGRFTNTNPALFPTVLELPELVWTDEAGEVQGSFGISSAVELRLTQISSGLRQDVGFEVEAGLNRHEVVWDPPAPLASSPPAARDPEGISAAAKDTPIPQPVWALLPNRPNPFN